MRNDNRYNGTISTNKIVFFNILSTFILQSLTFFTSPIISRMLGPNNYGLATIYVTWTAVVASVFGAQTQSTIAVSKKEYNTEELQSKYQSSIMFLSMVFYGCLTIIFLVFFRPIASFIGLQDALIFLMLIQGFGQFCVNFVNIKFTHEFKATQNFVLTIVVSGATLVLSIIFIFFLNREINFWGRILGLAIPYIIIGYFLCVMILLKGKHYIDLEMWKYCLGLSLPVIVHSVSNLLLNQFDRIMIQNTLSNTSVGIYSLACTFSAVLSTIWNALNNSWVPFYYEYSRKKEISEMKKHARNYLELFTVLSSGFVLLAPEVYKVFAGKVYWEGTSLITIFAIGYYFVFLYSFPVNYEFFNQKTKLIAVGTFFATVCNILLNFVLIKFFNIWGAALATSLAHGLQFLFHHVAASSIISSAGEYPFELKFEFPYFVVFMVFCIMCTLCTRFWILRWALGVIIGIFELHRIIKRRAIF